MTLAGIEEDAHIEGQVQEELVPKDCDFLQEIDTKRQGASIDSSKESTIENVELGLADTPEIRGDEVG